MSVTVDSVHGMDELINCMTTECTSPLTRSPARPLTRPAAHLRSVDSVRRLRHAGSGYDLFAHAKLSGHCHSRIAPRWYMFSDVQLVQDAGAEWIHVDVFDGNFVPNLTIGPPVVKAIRKHCPEAILDCHLCVLNPENYVEDMRMAGASQFTFHWEARGVDKDLDKARSLVATIREAGMNVGIALAPETPADVLFPLVDEGILDTILLMSVRPGFGGQKFMPSVLPKVEALRKRSKTVNIEVDGGITLENAKEVAQAGANVRIGTRSRSHALAYPHAPLLPRVSCSLVTRCSSRGPRCIQRSIRLRHRSRR